MRIARPRAAAARPARARRDDAGMRRWVPLPLLLRLVCWCAAVAVDSCTDTESRGLIVKFKGYAKASAHERTLAACVRAANGSHRVIERHNPAARLPTDFLVVEFPSVELDRLADVVRVRRRPCSAMLRFTTLRLAAFSRGLSGARVAGHRSTQKWPACTPSSATLAAQRSSTTRTKMYMHASVTRRLDQQLRQLGKGRRCRHSTHHGGTSAGDRCKAARIEGWGCG